MISDKLIDLTQPATHTSQKGICQCCRDYNLTKQQLHEFYDLKRESNVLYTGQSEEVDKIRELYKLFFKKEIGKDFTSRDWLQLGFQGDRPDRDLRGGGVKSLDLIIYYLQRQRKVVQDMVKQQNDFFFAVTAINIAFFMKKFFHLADYLQPEIDRHQFCGRRSFKNFCRIIYSQRDNFCQLHRLFLSYFYLEIWKKGSKKTLLHFNQSFQQFQQKVRTTFNATDDVDMNDIKRQFKTK